MEVDERVEPRVGRESDSEDGETGMRNEQQLNDSKNKKNGGVREDEIKRDGDAGKNVCMIDKEKNTRVRGPSTI